MISARKMGVGNHFTFCNLGALLDDSSMDTNSARRRPMRLKAGAGACSFALNQSQSSSGYGIVNGRVQM